MVTYAILHSKPHHPSVPLPLKSHSKATQKHTQSMVKGHCIDIACQFDEAEERFVMCQRHHA